MVYTPSSSSDATSPGSAVGDGQTSAQKIATQLEQSIIDDIQAVNERNWTQHSPLFYRKAPYWEAEVTAALSPKRVNCREFVDSVRKVTEKHPRYVLTPQDLRSSKRKSSDRDIRYKVRAVDFSTTVNEKTGKAEVFANIETSGLWDGVAQRNVTICEYHRINGIWYHVAHRTMSGLGIDIPR